MIFTLKFKFDFILLLRFKNDRLSYYLIIILEKKEHLSPNYYNKIPSKLLFKKQLSPYKIKTKNKECLKKKKGKYCQQIIRNSKKLMMYC